jgi:TRAP-type C4-dicarboxylate transport system permease small subunit
MRRTRDDASVINLIVLCAVLFALVALIFWYVNARYA